MPTVSICTNTSLSGEQKLQLAASLTDSIAEILRVPTGHVHCWIQDNQFLSFGGDAAMPAATITVQAATLQIREEMRKQLVELFMPWLSELGISPLRTTTFFQDLPVENIAVGSSVMVFKGTASSLLVCSPNVSPSNTPTTDKTASVRA